MDEQEIVVEPDFSHEPEPPKKRAKKNYKLRKHQKKVTHLSVRIDQESLDMVAQALSCLDSEWTLSTFARRAILRAAKDVIEKYRKQQGQSG